MAVVVCEAQLGAGVGALAADDHPRAGRPARQVEQVREFGDVAVVVAASASHRGEAFEAARRLIDDLKARVPIWKRQVFVDGDEEWVGTP